MVAKEAWPSHARSDGQHDGRIPSVSSQAGIKPTRAGVKAWVAVPGRMPFWATWRAGAPTRKSGRAGDAVPLPATD